MELFPISQHEISRVAGWFARTDSVQWLDFRNGKRALDPVTLKIMSARDAHVLRLFRPEGMDQPVGLVAFSQIEPAQGTAQLWYILGNLGLSGRG